MGSPLLDEAQWNARRFVEMLALLQLSVSEAQVIAIGRRHHRQ